ncbi:hypothetical protein FHU10_3833 [Serratia fonticola]|uniref:Uncharacterized protein n=1 Tax=Serratia fonticola TaxID=47917 RepID=A0A559T9B9_SERFO|nr:hypothetical protein FHU09_3874 [Serratia fonticola]TQI96718.1 hypothetical protein FHU11_2172 [Serratia fonticola]TVZ71214.1 hypothetical protein FHU10_3833 [Serratia fonticola]
MKCSIKARTLAGKTPLLLGALSVTVTLKLTD